MNERNLILLKYINRDILSIIVDYLIYVPWNIIDKITIDDFSKSITGWLCDKCQKSFYSDDVWYESTNECVDFCTECWPNYKPNYIIDDNDEKDECNNCSNIITGYDPYIISYWKDEPSRHLCINCNPKSRDEFKLFLSKEQNYVYLTMNGFGLVRYNISTISNRIIPFQLEGTISETMMTKWHARINRFMEFNDEFGPVKQWAIFTDDYEIPLFNIYTCLLIDCSSNAGRIAVMTDEHYFMGEARNETRICITVIFETFDDYLVEYNKWRSSKVDDETYDKIYNKVDFDVLLNDQCNGSDLLAICTEFSGYIIIQNNLDEIMYNNNYISPSSLEYKYRIINDIIENE